jgi:muramidase (phage lysozyme)
VYKTPTRTVKDIKAGDTTLADFLGFYEAGEGEKSYSAYNRGTEGSDPANKRIPQEKPVNKMTIGELLRDQSLPSGHPKRLFAVGKYQIIPKTMKDAVAKLDLKSTEVFDAKLQDRIFTTYLISKKRSSISKFIMGNPSISLDKAQNDMAWEWASIVDPTGKGKYDGKSNKAHTSVQAVRQVLLKARERYRYFVSIGHDSNEALSAAIGSQVTKLASNDYALNTVQAEITPTQAVAKVETPTSTVKVSALDRTRQPPSATVNVNLDPQPPRQAPRVASGSSDPTLTQLRDQNGRMVRTS